MLLPMEKIGLIEIETNPRDARVSLVKITSIGETKFEGASIALNETSERLLSALYEKQLSDFLKLLNLINTS